MNQSDRISIAIIKHYGLELDGDSRSETQHERVETIIMTWLQTYDSDWVAKAIVESLYRGRYKVKSIENILKDWQRRGNPFCQFTPDYEREILQSLPALPALPQPAVVAEIDRSADVEVIVSPRSIEIACSKSIDCQQLDPEESAPFQHYNFRSGSAEARLAQQSISSIDLVCQSLDALARKLADTHPIDRSIEETIRSEDRQEQEGERDPSISTPRAQIERSNNDRILPILNLKTIVSDRIISLPVRSHLFNTLRSIVEPNHQQQ
jgi:hypothetical protein